MWRLWGAQCSRDYPVAHMLSANLITEKQQSPRLACCVRLTQCKRTHTHTQCVAVEYIHFTFSTFVCVDKDLCSPLMKVAIDFTFRACRVFLDIGLGCSSIKMYIVARMHMVLWTIPSDWKLDEVYHIQKCMPLMFTFVLTEFNSSRWSLYLFSSHSTWICMQFECTFSVKNH